MNPRSLRFRISFGVITGLIGLGSIAYVCFTYFDVSRTHISANVPDSSVFDQLLVRDLGLYFEGIYKQPVSVTYELLQNTPAQSGLAYPKYYVWLELRGGADQSISKGVARVAAIKQERFDVVDFFSEEDIINNKLKLKQVFPSAVVEGILRRVPIH